MATANRPPAAAATTRSAHAARNSWCAAVPATSSTPRPCIRTSARSSRGTEFDFVPRRLLTVIPRACGDPVRRGFSVQSLLFLEYWVARSSRAMTTECAFAISRHVLPEDCIFVVPSEKSEGAGKTGCSLHPRSRVPSAHLEKTHTSIQVQRKHSGLPCAREFWGAKSLGKSAR